MKITVLGCGGSAGVPEIACQCEVCMSANPKNKRTRVSVLVETQGKRLLIDTSPDLRQQAISNGISHIDAILYTHDHADHIHGIDDVRLFNVAADASLPAYGDAKTLAALRARFAYLMQPKPASGVWFRPSLTGVEIQPPTPFDVQGLRVTPVLQQHAQVTSLGFRIGRFAYSTDVNGFSDASFAALEGLDVWVVDCLRYTPSVTHAHLEMTLGWVEKLKPKRTVFTHMAHQFEYEKLARELPPGIEPGYDGMVLELVD